MNEVIDTIKKRRSIRKFNGEPIPHNDIVSILEAGICAPSGCNNQEIRFITLSSDRYKKEFEAFKPFSKNCDTIILVLFDSKCKNSKIYRKSVHIYMPFIDAGLAMQNMVLATESLGYHSCICNLTPIHNKRIKNASLFLRAYCKATQLLGIFYYTKYSFNHFLRNELNISKRYYILGAVIVGNSDQKVDIHTAKHGPNPIKRKQLHKYHIRGF